jgi:hypothetical protein
MPTSKLPQRFTWLRHFFYRKESWKTTWKLRIGLLAIAIVLPLATQRFWTVRVAQSLVCTERTPVSDALLLENFDPDYLVFEQAETLLKAGVASRIFVPTSATDESGPNAVSLGTAEMMARIARIPRIEIIPMKAIEPISLNAANQIREALKREGIRSVVVVSPGFRSRRSELVYGTILTPAGIQVGCSPVFGRTRDSNWTRTWHGIQGVLEQFVKLQYYRFWVLL